SLILIKYCLSRNLLIKYNNAQVYYTCRCAGIPYIPAGQTRTFPCGGISWRDVNILLPGKEKCLTLCEVELHASTFQAALPSTATETAVTAPNLNLAWLWDLLRSLRRLAIRRGNVALMGRATQWSKLSRLTHAENAIDGRLDAECLSGSCAHTWLQSDPWWRVDLAVRKVTSITVNNREDCCPWRQDAAEILIGSSLKNNGNSNPQCAVISSIAAGDSVTFQCHGMEGHHPPGLLQPVLGGYMMD
ncbi:uncharacterized protein, partial [Salvelinus alpinus]|uniref:uncharacterized protein n=1 Tax=Salvelinus alpinus TaxID=8036 RepID=UPI0039FCD0A5